MPSNFLVPSGDEAARGARHPGRVVHAYANGAVVVEAASARDRPSGAEPVLGLHLPVGASRAQVSAARRLISQAELDPVPEDEPEVAAYVEFVAPPDPTWLSGMQGRQVTVLCYQPDNSYLVRGRPSVLAKLATDLRTSSGDLAVRSVTELTGALKAAPATLAEAGEDTVIVLAATSGERAHVKAALGQVPGVDLLPGSGNDVLDDQRIRVRARVDAAGLAALLALPHVLSIESFTAAVPDDELAGLIIAGKIDLSGHPRGSYDQWLAGQSLDGSGAVIGIVDGGVDVSHPAFAGRIKDLAGGRKDWHATMVAGHAAGAYRTEHDAEGYIYGLGTAPAAAVLSQDRNAIAGDVCAQTVSEAASDFAVQNNSWGRGGPSPMDYGSEEAIYDALVRDAHGATNHGPGGQARPLTICFSSGNTGDQGLTRPKAAKNVIVTGNSENFRPHVGGADSDSISDVYVGSHPSSHGNCGDGRIRPHLVAPGEWTAAAAYDVLPGEPDFVSPLITWGGGSSGASPKTAGACALLAQWWRRWHNGANPSPAMLRALLVNGAEPIDTGGPVPNNIQGWGRLSLRAILDPDVSRLLVDQTDLLTVPTQTRQWAVRVVDPAKPVKVTLAWTDPPGAVGTGTATASPIVNRLALRVVDATRTWRGAADRFRNGWTADDSTLSGASLAPEGADNLQCVFLPAGTAEFLVVTVTALAVTTDALAGGFANPQQDFALVIGNAEVDRASTESTVVVGLSSDDTPAVSVTPEEDAWWAAGMPADRESPRAAEAVKAVAHVLNEVADDVSATVIAEAGRLGAVADSVGERLTATKAVSAAVLGVQRGARATDDDMRGLRALASIAKVFLVSDDAEILSGVLAALGPHPALRYRLADDRTSLPDTLRDVAFEAGGLEQLVVGETSVDGLRAARLEIIEPDDRLVVALPAQATEVLVSRPGDVLVRVGVGEAPAYGMQAVVHEGRSQLLVERPGEHPGVWAVRASDEGAEGLPTAWVHGGGAGLTLEARRLSPTRAMIRVTAGRGSLLKRLSVPRRRLSASDTVLESDRPLVVGVRPSRLDLLEGGVRPEAAGGSLPVPALGHVVELSDSGPAVLDIPVAVFGTDARGVAFSRHLHTNVLVEGAAAREAETRRPTTRATTQVTGSIVEMKHDGTLIVGVTVTDSRRVRTLDVADGPLRTALPMIPRNRPVVLGVRESTLVWLYVPFSIGSAQPPAAAAPRSEHD